MSNQREKKRRVHVSTTILPELKDGLQELADAEERTVGFFIEKAVAQYLITRRPPLFPNQPQTFEL